MTEVILSVDCSTSAAKCVAWDRTGTALAVGRASLPLSVPEPGYGEQDPQSWWSATVDAIRDCLDALGDVEVRALAVTHQRETFVCLDDDGHALRPAMLWLDTRAQAQVAAFGTARIHELTGKPANPTPAFYKLLWLAEHEPGVLASTARVVDVHGYLAHRMTGHWRTSIASADPLGLIDLASGDYADEILAQVGLSRAQLPELVAPGALLGELKVAAAAELGLPVGTPVIAGAGDGQSAGLGAGITEPGLAYLNVGTGLISGSYSDEFKARTSYRAMAGTVAGSVNYELFVGAGTFLVTWFLNTVADPAEVPEGVAAEGYWQQRAAEVAPGAQGLFVLPYWNGQLTPYWDANARGLMIGLSGVHDRAHIYRAVLEGIAFELRWCLELAEPDFPEPIREFRTMGGGSRSPLWCQIFADVLQRPLVLTGHDEATALGTGILAAAGSGWYDSISEAATAMTRTGSRFEPDPEQAARYDELYASYRQIYPAVRELFGHLSPQERHD